MGGDDARWYRSYYSSGVDRRTTRLLDLLDSESDGETVGTSIRLPVNLREAAALAADLGLARSTSELTVGGLRDVLASFAQRAILEEHYRVHPDARPDLAEVALAAAELDANPLVDRPDLIERAAREITMVHPGASADDVLLYAAGLASAVA